MLGKDPERDGGRSQEHGTLGSPMVLSLRSIYASPEQPQKFPSFDRVLLC